MKTSEEALGEARAEGLKVHEWSEEQRDGYYFSRLPLEVRLQNTCRGCGGTLVSNSTKALAFVLGPPKLGRCSMCGWVGTKPIYFVTTDKTGVSCLGPFASHAEASRVADEVRGYITTSLQSESGVTLGSVGIP